MIEGAEPSIARSKGLDMPVTGRIGVIVYLTIGDAESLYGLVNGVNPASIEHISLDDTNFLYDCGYPYRCGSYYLYANDQSFKSLSHFVQSVFPPPTALADAAAGHELCWFGVDEALELDAAGLGPELASGDV